jgi:transcriptional regulator with XRE-family HTH domain
MFKIGPSIRDVRRSKKVTLVELAEKTGVAQATLSRIETGGMTGTIESHMKIAEALGTTLADLYTGVDTRHEKVDHGTSNSRPPEKMGTSASIEALTTNTSDKKMSPTLIRVNSLGNVTFKSEEVGVEKFIYCVKGDVILDLGENSYHLKTGESLYFDASISHVIKNTSRVNAELFSITSPPRI